MKKISLMMITLCIIAAAPAVHSQSLASAGKLNETYFENKLPESMPVTTPNGTTRNVKALKTFNSMYGDVSNVIWVNVGRDHDRACFVKDGITVRTGFNRKGNVLYTLRYYTEEHLPKDVLLQIKNYYYGKSIFGIVEVTVDGKTAYLVDLEDKTSWLKIKVLDGEMTEENLLLKP